MNSQTCPKCGEGKLDKVTYVAARKAATIPMLGLLSWREIAVSDPVAEHLLRSCNVCGYQRKEICKDRALEKK